MNFMELLIKKENKINMGKATEENISLTASCLQGILSTYELLLRGRCKSRAHENWRCYKSADEDVSSFIKQNVSFNHLHNYKTLLYQIVFVSFYLWV